VLYNTFKQSQFAKELKSLEDNLVGKETFNTYKNTAQEKQQINTEAIRLVSDNLMQHVTKNIAHVIVVNPKE
jgi:ribosomal protein S25